MDKIKALKAAFPYTIPVFTGFTFLGIAYGILMTSKGYGLIWTLLMSLFVFAGSSQYVAITFLTTAFNPVNAFLMSLAVNARHIFYGLSLLDKYKDMDKIKPYLIFGLCDETFSIVCSTEAPEGVSKKWFAFFITLLDHMYWVLGSVVGSLLGYMIPTSIDGLDFVLTALFVIIFVGHWKTKENRKAAAIGVICSVVALLIFGPDNFIIPSMIAIITVLTLGRKSLDRERIAKI
ncbi:MAG TPA: branched-chain amino acid ABC transporter permease [Clostridiales bacterium]|nr:branched-chain amino acid ABC transporter permease [Clostridiales bacterium]